MTSEAILAHESSIATKDHRLHFQTQEIPSDSN